jgi:hypothetical protein
VAPFELESGPGRFAALALPNYIFKIAFMGNQVAQWLLGEFTFLGFHFQNWMPVALAIVALAIFQAWRQW